MKTKFSLLVFSYLFAFSCSNAQTAPVLISDSLQSIFDASLPSKFTNSGGVIGIVVPGKWSWYSSSGKAIAGITAGHPMTLATPSTQFRVGSITKSMVATCILKLEQSGVLSIEDPINLYLRPTLITDTIASSDIVRIRHLLNHTSGIANSGDNSSCQTDVLTNPLNSRSLEYAINCGASLGEIFPPGFAWAYSNTNYSILAMIIENVTGQTYRDYLTQNIITPLGLTQTEIPTTDQIVNPHMGCYWNIGSWVDLTIINPTTYTGWADVVSTTSDLLIYYNSLLSGGLINAAELAKMKTIDPAAFGYGLGMDFYTIAGIDYYGHYGEVANTSGMMFANTSSIIAPNGYYISYNYNTQGVDMQNLLDVPVFQLLNSNYSGVDEAKNYTLLHIFPVPAKEYCTIEISNCAEDMMLVVTDMLGRELFISEISSGTKNIHLNLKEYDKGVYLVNLIGKNSSTTRKLIVE